MASSPSLQMTGFGLVERVHSYGLKQARAGNSVRACGDTQVSYSETKNISFLGLFHDIGLKEHVSRVEIFQKE
jgi:hypothetical protein